MTLSGCSSLATFPRLARSNAVVLITPRLVSTIFESNDLWSPGTQAVCYEGLESAREACRQWYEERLSKTAVLDDRRESEQAQAAEAREAAEKNNSADEAIGNNGEEAEEEYELDQLDWAVCEPIVDRKSVFVGHAVALSSPTQVKPFLRQLKSDKKIAKATHNIVAWRCRVAVSCAFISVRH